MTLTKELFHKIADPTITPNERARRRCELAKQLELLGDYEGAREAMGELWQGVGERPVLDGLESHTAAEVLLRVGSLTGWLGSSKQIKGAQEKAKNLIYTRVLSWSGRKQSSLTEVMVQEFELDRIPQPIPRAAEHPVDELAPQLTEQRLDAFADTADEGTPRPAVLGRDDD